MARRGMVLVLVAAAVLAADLGAPSAAWAQTSLLLPQSTAFTVLGHSCGGIQEQVQATGFDAGGGPTGAVYLQTRCGGSGRGGGYHVTTYLAWVGVTWDFTGAVLSSEVLAAAPSGLDPTFSAVDAFGNEVANQLSAINVTPDSCTVGNTTYCTYRAYLTLAPGFVPPPRVASVSVASGPASGGTTVAITGTGFTGATAVTFGDAPAASFVVNGDTSITAVSPATNGGTVDVTVTTAGGTSAASPADEFTFVAAPVVSGLSPDSGTVDGGTIVTITGASLGDATGVDFGGTPAGFTVIDDATISAISPPGEAPDTVRVRVTSLGGTSANSPANVFTYTASTGCGGACPPPPPSIVCGRLAGNLARSLTVARCTPRSTTERRASLTTDFTTLTWKPSGETTVLSLTATSPGQGACRTGSTEYDLTGTVVGGTSSYVPAGEAVSGQICLSPRGHVTLVKGTTFGL